ncbi:MAG: response regulator [Streptosporangiaceae bacterium]
MSAGGQQTASPPARPAPADGPRILVAEDEPALLRALRITLRARGYAVATAATGQQALAAAAEQPPDAILLDLGLPDIDGITVIRELRGWCRAPVIVLSGRAGSGDKIGALDAGADDYVTKPFDTGELLARLRAALRRDAGGGPPDPVPLGRWRIDLASRSVTGREDSAETVALTGAEWRLLAVLLDHPGQLVSDRRLLAELSAPGTERGAHRLRVQLAGLRRKLEDDPARPRHLVTEPGLGYRYQP